MDVTARFLSLITLISSAQSQSPSVTIVAEVASATTFRLGVRFNGWSTEALSNPSLPASSWTPAPSTPISWSNGLSGVQTSFGALLTDGSSRWVLVDANNDTLVESNGTPFLNNGSNSIDAGIVLPVQGTAAANGPGRQCLGNGFFGPTFYYNRDASYLAFASSSWDYDPTPQNHHCYPVSFSGNIGTNVGSSDMCTNIQNYTDANGARTQKYPNGLQGQSLASCCAACEGDPECVGYVFSDGTNPDPNGNCWPMASISSTYNRVGRLFGSSSLPPMTAWWGIGQALDWYFAPVQTPLNFTRVFYELTGAPALPPRYALGFSATYWGYVNMEEVEGYMTDFRDGLFPVDTFIMDYDFWNTKNNPDLDFDYDTIMFGPHNFTHPSNSTIPNASTTDAPSLFAHFHKDLNMRFGGIRKPRTYNHLALSNSSGWLLPNSFDVGAGDSNWNMSAPGWQDWYVTGHIHFLKDGLDMWWNDEGETQWFTYTSWNIAQKAMVDAVLPGKRHWTINRSFQAGMQSFPAITWTGDRQDCSHKTVLTFTVAGQLYTACDMAAPDTAGLVRQYQNAIFLPIMRVHAMHGTPRFPFLWGFEAEPAFRKALNMRYHFIPHILSLVYLARETGQPLALPASYIFPNDPSFPVSLGDATYMFSDVLLPADVSTTNTPDPNVNTTHVNIPPGVWYNFNDTSTIIGPITDLTYTNVALDHIVLFVRSGAILTLNRDVVQYSDALGGALEVQIYGGNDGKFELVEDDGETLDYMTSPTTATRRTLFQWVDSTRTLSWSVSGGFSGGNNLYTMAYPVLFTSNATAPVYATGQALGQSGFVVFGT